MFKAKMTIPVIATQVFLQPSPALQLMTWCFALEVMALFILIRALMSTRQKVMCIPRRAPNCVNQKTR